MTKYYNLVETGVTDYFNIGVVAITDGKADISNVKQALKSHFDAEITDVEVQEGLIGEIEVSFTIERMGEMERETAIGYQTWLYI